MCLTSAGAPAGSYSPGVSRFLEAALPSAGALVFFALGLRALIHADRRERAAAARFEREQDAREAGPAGGRAGSAGGSERTVSDDAATDADHREFPTDPR